jgi:hypothetical protein
MATLKLILRYMISFKAIVVFYINWLIDKKHANDRLPGSMIDLHSMARTTRLGIRMMCWTRSIRSCDQMYF